MEYIIVHVIPDLADQIMQGLLQDIHLVLVDSYFARIPVLHYMIRDVHCVKTAPAVVDTKAKIRGIVHSPKLTNESAQLIARPLALHLILNFQKFDYVLHVWVPLRVYVQRVPHAHFINHIQSYKPTKITNNSSKLVFLDSQRPANIRSAAPALGL